MLQEHQKKVGPHGVNEINMYNSEVSPIFRVIPEIRTMEDLRTMVDGYDCGIRHMDEHIGAIFELLENKGSNG